MAKAGADLEQVEVLSRAEWRQWLAAHHQQSASIWLVTLKKAAAVAEGQGFIGYDAIVEEALCFGWVDSLPRAMDARRTTLLLSPRKPGSAWSAINRARVDALTAAGLMQPAGLAAVAAAQANGGWDKLVDVDALSVPADLAVALRTSASAARCFSRFPPSSRRAILEWITQAKTPETRAKRIALTVECAAENRKANFPAGRDHGPPDKLP